MIRRPGKSEIKKRTRNTPNRVLAIPAAASGRLEQPRNAAAISMPGKKTDQDNM
jgi:hypothetical protein